MPRIRPSASLYAGATYSGRPLGAEKSQADHRVASERAMRHPAYGLLRIPLPRTPVNKPRRAASRKDLIILAQQIHLYVSWRFVLLVAH